ncbi:uncharacterized protein GIQ15_05718 [Arthroderma uncinatum]|uniref:uncharacterized protein n=1 Tax=Arthroderma uncinatum TaxID=74035 RepID=UPI00144A95B9|nr:uncharacterized protein GIQ15_05718 [Arthroderma uncinatum]KAF3480371.1 hypothetical protein GIQ15_05718 [Arthroderma uncinatum]
MDGNWPSPVPRRFTPLGDAHGSSIEPRDLSRSPSLSPTPAISSCPSPDRTFSTVSSISNFSGDARSSVSAVSASAGTRRRGYIRPQGATFAESAKNRESVMSLGSIAHLQYYFARTGLLDGKGAQMAKARKSTTETDIPKLTLSQQVHLGGDLVESPIEGFAEFGDEAAGWEEDEEHEPLMLPPTVSTYSIRTHYIPPPPDLNALRHDLQTALEKARHVLTASKDELAAQKKAASELNTAEGLSETEADAEIEDDEQQQQQQQQKQTPSKKHPKGWDEIEGMHILDLVTLAIRAARIYYTAHEHPERLSLIKSEKEIRGELLSVLEVLKRWASRSFAGGLKDKERSAILDWIDGVGSMLDQERKMEEGEKHKRKSWTWTSGDWSGKERDREYQFLQNLPSAISNPLPAWEPVEEDREAPSAFLARLRDGRDLVRFHNEAVKLSYRQFEEIKTFHDDIGKPYRMADNLRYWVKAAEIRWEIRLEVDVMGVVTGDKPEAWKGFDAAVLQWCQGVREELLRDWSSRDAESVKAPSSTLSPMATVPLMVAIDDNPGIKHWKLFIDAEANLKTIIHLLGARHRYFINVRTPSDARVTSSVLELCELCQIDPAKIDAIKNIGWNTPVRNEVSDYSCQDLVLDVLEKLEEQGLVDADEQYMKNKETVISKRESWPEPWNCWKAFHMDEGVRKCSRGERRRELANTNKSSDKTTRHILAAVQVLGDGTVKNWHSWTRKNSNPTPIVQPLPTPAAGRANVSMPPGTAGPGKRSGVAVSQSTSPPSTPSPVAVDLITPKRSSVHSAAQRIASWSPSSFPSSFRGSTTPAPTTTSTTTPAATTSSTKIERETALGHKGRQSIFRRLSPSLAARVRLLDGASSKSETASVRSHSKSPVGKIPASQLQELERQNRHQSIQVQRRGRAWSGGLVAPQGAQEPDSDSFTVRRAVDEEEEEEEEEEDHRVDDGEDEELSIPKQGATDTSTSFQTMVTATATGASHGPSGAYTDNTDIDLPPPPPPKDTPPIPHHSSSGSNASESYFNPLGLSRTDSIYSFSRASFSNQLSQLTSISLPQPSTLEESIASISSAPAAVRALSGAAEQIQKWTNKASEVLGGLEAEDDVEWAAAGGREGLDDVDKAVTKFESLINVYVKAIEEVQVRDDIAEVGSESLNNIVTQMEQTIRNWGKVGSLLHGVKEQVELAMEWEELWNAVLGDVGLEIDNLSRMIFEMEEKRHKAVMVSDADNEPTTGLDINELETIVEETPSNVPSNPRLNFAPILPSGSQTPGSENQQDESSLLALFARMQPLRASLDFLPMRLSMFQTRAKDIFPSACEELEDRRLRLEQGYKKLETDSEALRRELGEDRWVIVFRNAGKQAHKMCESVERSVGKLQEAIEGGIQHNNPTALAKRAENFEAKKVHYGSAIERVLSIIQKGINDRLTVNGEIIRLLADLTARFDALQSAVHSMDALLDDLNSRQLRDSVSSILTLESPAARSIGTPGSSPASSIIMSNGNNMNNSNNHTMIKDTSRRSSVAGGGTTTSRGTSAKLKRHSALPQPSSCGIGHTPRKPSIPRAVTTPKITTTNTNGRPVSRIGAVDPLTALTYSNYVPDGRPRWNATYNTKDLVVGHVYKQTHTPSPSSNRNLPVPISSRSPRPAQQHSSYSFGLRSPLSRESSASPAPGRSSSRLHRGVTDRGMLDPGSSHGHGHSPSPSPSPRPSSMFDPPPYSKLRKQAAAANSNSAITSTAPRATASKLTPPAPIRMRSRTPLPAAPTPKAAPTPAPAAPVSKPALPSAPRSRQSYAGIPSARSSSISTSNDGGAKKSAPPPAARPGTALGHSNRRSSMLPLPRTGAAGRLGMDGVAGGKKDDRPPWR